MSELLKWLDTTDFYEAPASTRYHGSYRGGLVEHSLNVYDEMIRLLNAYPEIKARTSDDSVVICALFHDLCKANTYTVEQRNRRTYFGDWETYDYYSFNEELSYGGHGCKSVFLVQRFIHDLKVDEAVAINCHMSSWEDGAKRYVGEAFEQFPLAWVLHVADEAATHIREGRP